MFVRFNINYFKFKYITRSWMFSSRMSRTPFSVQQCISGTCSEKIKSFYNLQGEGGVQSCSNSGKSSWSFGTVFVIFCMYRDFLKYKQWICSRCNVGKFLLEGQNVVFWASDHYWFSVLQNESQHQLCALITVFVIILLYIYNAMFNMLKMAGPLFFQVFVVWCLELRTCLW